MQDAKTIAALAARLEVLGDAFANRARKAGMVIQHIQPCKPNQNACIERLNRTYLEALLDQPPFQSLEDVREATNRRMIKYKEVRLHDALGDPTPMTARQEAAGNNSLELSNARGSLRKLFS